MDLMCSRGWFSLTGWDTKEEKSWQTELSQHYLWAMLTFSRYKVVFTAFISRLSLLIGTIREIQIGNCLEFVKGFREEGLHVLFLTMITPIKSCQNALRGLFCRKNLLQRNLMDKCSDVISLSKFQKIFWYF